MKVNSPASMPAVTSQAPVSVQSLLVPSAVCHHELRRMLTMNHQPVEANPPISIRVNSLGCRGDEVEVPAPAGTYRILLLGDDSICGAWVAETETVAARLKQFLSKSTTASMEVINCGVPGYCPLLAALKFEHDLARLKPDLVILHVDMTDVADDACYRSLVLQEGQHAVCSHPTLRMKPRAGNPLTQLTHQSAVASWALAKARQYGPQLLSVNNLVPMASTDLSWISDNPPDLRIQVRHAFEPIRQLQDAVAKSGGRLLVTTSPVLWQVVSAEEAPRLSRQLGIKGTTPFSSQFPFEVLASFCQESGIHFRDASSAFHNENAERLFSKDSPTLSRIGMALYAREIARSLLEDPPTAWKD
jgi:hypothetical protein